VIAQANKKGGRGAVVQESCRFLSRRVRGVAWLAEDGLQLCRDEFWLAGVVGGGVVGPGQGDPAGPGKPGEARTRTDK